MQLNTTKGRIVSGNSDLWPFHGSFFLLGVDMEKDALCNGKNTQKKWVKPTLSPLVDSHPSCVKVLLLSFLSIIAAQLPYLTIKLPVEDPHRRRYSDCSIRYPSPILHAQFYFLFILI